MTGDLVIPEGVLRIGEGAFNNTGLTGVTVPDSVTDFGEKIFHSCHDLSSVSLPESMEAIPKYMFLGCKSLTSIELPENLTTIGECAFQSSGLTELTLPASLKECGISAFYKNWELADFTILCETTMDNVASLVQDVMEDAVGDFYDGKPHHVTIHVASGSVTEGYIKREMEKNPKITEYVTLETF